MTIQREFKFRAWNKERKEMFKVGQVWTLEPYSVCAAVVDQHDNYYSMHDIALMQYTGMKDDKGNGVEIYEGDILEYDNRACDKKNNGDVNFLNGAFRVSNSEFNFIETIYIGNGKVVGNIYENPEILIKYYKSIYVDYKGENNESN